MAHKTAFKFLIDNFLVLNLRLDWRSNRHSWSRNIGFGLRSLVNLILSKSVVFDQRICLGFKDTWFVLTNNLFLFGLLDILYSSFYLRKFDVVFWNRNLKLVRNKVSEIYLNSYDVVLELNVIMITYLIKQNESCFNKPLVKKNV